MYMYTRTIEKKERFCSNLISILKKKVVEKERQNLLSLTNLQCKT